MDFDKAQELSEKQLLRIRELAFRQLRANELSIDQIYNQLVGSLKLQLKQASPAQIGRIARSAILDATLQLVPILEAQIQDSTLRGDEAARRQFESVFTPSEIAVAGASFQTTTQAMALASARIRGSATVDNVRLSSRMWRNHRRLSSQMAALIQRTIRAGASMQEISNEILRLERPELGETLHVQRLRAQAKRAVVSGDRNAFDEAVTRFEKSASRLGSAADAQFSLRPAATQLASDVRRAVPDQIERHIDRFVSERARNHTKLIARTETVEAYRDSYRKSTKDKDYVVGYRWVLGANHPRIDICDQYAGQDLHGLGPGGYPPGDVPPTPHPADLCSQVAIIDSDHFKRQRAVLSGEPDPPRPWLSARRESSVDWLQRQRPVDRKLILGKGASEIFEREPARVLGAHGKARRLRDILAD